MKKLFVVLLCFTLSFSGLFPSLTEAAQISDVKTTDAKYKAIQWAVDSNVISNQAGNQFSPTGLVSEYQLLQSIAKLDPNYYSSSYSSDEVYNYYSDLYLPIKGTNNRASRNANVTRGQFARIVSALNGMDLSTVQAVQYLYVNEITSGTTGKKTYADFNAFNNLTRGDLAVFLYRIAKNNVVSYEGLASSASGDDNGKVTLPPNFENSGTITLKPPSSTTGNVSTPGNEIMTTEITRGEAVSVTAEEIVTNNYDASLVTINLKDIYGNEISYDESLTYNLTSKEEAKLGSNPNNGKVETTTIQTDGGELNFYVKAPKSNESISDTITLELQNNSNRKYSHIRKIRVPLKYVAKPEMRIEYEYFDPEQQDWDWINVVKTPDSIEEEVEETPLPALPNVQPNTYDANNLDITNKTIDIIGQGTSRTVPYKNAEIRFNDILISEWLFEKIVINTSYKLQYSINNNNTVYNLLGDFDDRYYSDKELIREQIDVLRLIDQLPSTTDLSIIHYDSVRAVKKAYDDLSFDQLYLDDEYDIQITKLLNSDTIVNKLKELEESLNPTNPGPDTAVDPNAKPYTKITITMIEPGGRKVSDFTGKAFVELDGETLEAEFNDGVATVTFKKLVYGESEVTVNIPSSSVPNSDDRKTFKRLLDEPITKEIFTNPPFINPNKCDRDVEVGFVVDHSGSMLKADPENYTAAKTQQLVRQMEEENNIAVRFNHEGALEAEGSFDEVLAKNPPIYESNTINGGTNIFKGLKKAYSYFSKDSNLPRHVVLLSDGKSSPSQINEIINDARANNDVIIHTVLVGKQNKSSITLMKQISHGTGGQFFHIEDILDLHRAYQAIHDAILCGTTVSTDFCPIDNAFEEADVDVRYTNELMMHAVINPVCSNIEKVVVRFTSQDGQYQYDLISRGQGVFRANHADVKHQTYNLYADVEFLAYDEKGNLVGKKSVRSRTLYR